MAHKINLCCVEHRVAITDFLSRKNRLLSMVESYHGKNGTSIALFRRDLTCFDLFLITFMP